MRKISSIVIILLFCLQMAAPAYAAEQDNNSIAGEANSIMQEVAQLKEEIIDDEFNLMDIFASVLGAVPVFIATALGVLFHTLSN